MLGQEIKELALHPAPNFGLFLSQGPRSFSSGAAVPERALCPTNSTSTRLLSLFLHHTPGSCHCPKKKKKSLLSSLIKLGWMGNAFLKIL